ncbi:hypothetical protein GYMLUDRAFT_206438 [Collybiopsis luxurians FD-317 M1]|uniref:Bromo domain-containing protein n=1 Tax=Collybiopsis luxurians FD-317 M1 TaxID=944289 RepID=A0A0D0AVD4_9AGAR|nr:hypothetical protein GYMLUDRAFT_206438 [Collybiopsis luxurians FD-317 M1]
MAITTSQKTSISSILDTILSAVATPPSKQAKAGEIGVGGHGAGSGRGRKRVLSAMFLVLLDRNDWAEYYELIPNPRALHPIRDMLAENKYTDPLEVFTDLSLVFWNAMFYNEKESQISKDAAVLKDLLEVEWAKHTDLPQPRSRSPPPGSAQKAYPDVELEERRKEEERQKERAREEKEKEVQQLHLALKKVDELGPETVESEPVVEIVDEEESVNGVSESESENVDQTDVASEFDIESQVEYSGLDVDNDAIVHHLDSSLPRWPGFAEDDTEGWLVNGNTEVYSALLHAIKGHKDVIGNRLATALEAIPDAIKGPTSTTQGKPISIKAIEVRIKSHSYPSPASFDMDMMLLFEKGRRWWEPTPTNTFRPSEKPSGNSIENYAKVLILQRLYQALTSPHSAERPSSAPPYSSETNFASLHTGPGRININGDRNTMDNPSVVSGSNQITAITMDRVFLHEIKYKGWTFRVGDWVHLANGSDINGGSSGRPIVAQIWKVWSKKTSDDGAGFGQEAERCGVTVCWYYRPQETFHSSQRVFWENEVFKSNHFASHPLPDIIEPVYVQFSREHIRGRPRRLQVGNGWYIGWPLYVCDSRYSYSKGNRAYRNYLKRMNGQVAARTDSSSSAVFVRIRNWSSCMPPEVSQNQPSKLSDRFTSGRLIFPFERTVFPRRRPSPFLDGTGGGGPGGLVQDDGSTDKGPTKGFLIGTVGGAKVNGVVPLHANTSYQSASQYYQNQYSSQVPVAASSTSTTSLAKPPKPDRTTTVKAVAQGSQYELSRLPSETTRHFSRDPATGSLLWFPSPPVDVPGRQSTTQVGHSFGYLHWRATKRNSVEKPGELRTVDTGLEESKNKVGLGKRKGDSWQVNGIHSSDSCESSTSRKKQRTTMIETIASVLKSS